MDFSLNISSKKERERTAKEQEAQLIQACLEEKRWAQKELYERFYGRMLGVCLRYSNNSEDARDILNEGYIKVFRYLHRYKVGTSLDAWIRRIMINTSIDFYRKAIRHRSEDIETAQHKISEDADAISRYSAKEIMAVIQKLPPSYRAVFNLYAIEGYSHREVAQQLGITESTSRSNLVKARAKLREYIKQLYH
ncbi:RNA polymerase sigma factor [Saprospira grandis]|uniref:RNA polymerase sigma factor n=1 Tax=Saprospira grandis TaxID=1008 RepID=UPI0022DE7F33|nr:sigma-70 family RNA polymerase sigma factor [Saprospira grandis]WBM75394.1 sigma-70 family RNA polymerase sigma factor [Saprospira grandis]